ncbi:GGDEF domain-containing protein [Halopseudomonas nanhaiensis]|uniref:GGDEF domain-containing protein n=1 Tax=Halopseudomonas nanhaiensis TaxID=2830842 RepID=UPI001CBD3F9E|nr:GGDEF domain-containing protein [Halopseudomonas nanhaiensis]UAW99650.1 GGDEF domain-containing protein [Halopseudomonas nanhaiensis]
MIAHTPSIFASVAWVAAIMAFCLFVVGRSTQRDGMLVAAAGLLSHALGYMCFTSYGHTPLWLSYAVGNTLLSAALASYSASIFRISDVRVPWAWLFCPTAIMAVGLAVLIDTREPRMLVASGVLMLQCALIIRFALHRALADGRAHLLLITGAAVSLVGIGIRVLTLLFGTAEDMRYDVSNIKQTISVSIGTVTVIMLSLGLILLSKERIEARLVEFALRDPLTGIWNRRAVLEQLDREIERSRRSGASLALVLIDLDDFKLINDQHGHQIGDAVLRHSVELLEQQLRQSDAIGRFGGEEFLLILPEIDTEAAMLAANRLRTTLLESPTPVDGLRVPCSISAGVWCGVPAENDSPSGLIARADEAMYRAKAAGRNRVCLAGFEALEIA